MTKEKRLGILLSDLCVKLGFCLHFTESKKLLANPPVTPKEFANAVFRAEGMDPELFSRDLYKQVEDMISNAFEEINRIPDA